jgi:hypothetical protein
MKKVSGSGGERCNTRENGEMGRKDQPEEKLEPGEDRGVFSIDIVLRAVA